MACAGGANQSGCRECVVRWVARRVWLNLRGVQQCQVITPLQLYFSYKAAFTNAQVCCDPLTETAAADRCIQPWRVFTTFWYFGPISLDFVFHMFFL